jgi:hypothetical protein
MPYGTLLTDTINASTGVLATQNGMTGIAKAWVNCTSTTINGSFNVSSITLPSTGRFQINFTTAMPSANYVMVASGAPATDIAMTCYTGYQPTWGTNSTTACFVTAANVVGPALINPTNLYVAIIGA